MYTGNCVDWYTLASMPLVDSDNEIALCPSCMGIFSNDEIKTYNDYSGDHLFRSTRIIQSLNLTAEEVAVLKAVCVTNPGSKQRLFPEQRTVKWILYAK